MAAPKLRFKEFDKAFSRNTIKELAKIYVGRDLVEDAYSPVKTETHIYPIYSNSVDNEGLYGYYNFEEFNFDDGALTVVGRGAGLGKAFYRQGGFGTIGRLLSLTPKDKRFHPKYLSDYINDKLIIHNESGGIPQLPRSSLENYEVVLPSYEEQTKIASFLSSVDEKINQLTQKHQLLSQYKQGMMKKLFSQQIRFKADDGSEFGEWEEKTIGEIGEVVTGKTPSTTNSNAWNGNVLFVTPTDMKGNKYQNTTIRTVANKQPKVLPQNTIMFTCIASIGKMALSVKPSITNQQINSIIVKNDHPEFIYYQLLNMVDYIKSTQANTTLPIINKTEFSKFFLRIPQQAEQTKIANFLSTIDQKIEVVTQQIEQAKQWKKGLLQQMFV